MQERTTSTVTFPSTAAKDVMTEILRDGAQKMLAVAVEAEVTDWIDRHAHVQDAQGHRQVVRNGYLPERSVTTGIGEVQVRQPRVRDRRPDGEQEKFTSKILPPYLRKTKSIEDLIPWLYLMVFKLSQAAEKKWRLLNGAQIIPDVIAGVRFIDGVREDKAVA